MGGGLTYQIIGVSTNIKARFLGEAPKPVLFRSLPQTIAADPSFEGYTLLVATSARKEPGIPIKVRQVRDSSNVTPASSRHLGFSDSDSPSDATTSSLAPSVRSVIRELDPTLAVFNEQTMEHHLREAYFLPRLAGTLFAVFGTVGLLLAAIGLYGVMNYTVSLRTREIGIRMALGAQAKNVQSLILLQGLKLTAIALTIGFPAAYAVAKLFSSILYGIQPHDTLTFISIPLFLSLIAALAAYLPARRASQVDPASTLRSE